MGFAEAGFAETDFAEADFTKETNDDDDDDDSIANDFIGDSEGEMEGGESFSMKRKKLHFCKKKISGCEFSAAKFQLVNDFFLRLDFAVC